VGEKDNSRCTSAVAPNLAILEKLQGLWLARAIHVAVRLGLPGLLGNGPKRLSELASTTDSNEPALHRLLRCLKHLGIITEISPEFYSGTSLSERLQRDRSDSLYWLSMLYGDEWQLRAWERLEDSIRTGRSGMSCAFGIDLWTYLDQHPDSAELYDKALSGLSALNDRVAKAYEFPESAVVIDIGGGQGDFLRRILARNSTVRGVLFDRKPVIDSAGIGDDPSCRDRVSLIAGDFFQSIPPDGNIYVLKQVLHDWDDPRASAILQSCRRVMTPGTKLLIVELVIPEAGPAALLGSLIDLHMLVMHSGQERTADEFSHLCGAAGFKLTRIVATGTPICIIEGAPI
jgi:ubiquinone/menaquinone biosynthesis C-methylase UbiE